MHSTVFIHKALIFTEAKIYLLNFDLCCLPHSVFHCFLSLICHKDRISKKNKTNHSPNSHLVAVPIQHRLFVFMVMHQHHRRPEIWYNSYPVLFFLAWFASILFFFLPLVFMCHSDFIIFISYFLSPDENYKRSFYLKTNKHVWSCSMQH